MNFPCYDIVPKDFDANVKFRKDIFNMCKDDKSAQQDIYDMCARDILFYVNTFLYTIDPRNTEQSIVPFLTYDYQDNAMSDIMDVFGKEDILFEKSRDMGATWINLIPIEWHWHFSPNRLTFLLVSRKGEYVYMKGDEKALFSKIDMMHEYLPQWLQPTADRKEMHYRNLLTGSTMDGEATTGDVGRGDRRTVIFMDEFAAVEIKDGYRALKSTRATTACRIFNSTYQGVNNAFYETASETDIKKIRFHWSMRPEFRAGLYQSKDGVVEILDDEYVYPQDYEFIADDKLRSPWYDEQEARTPNPQEMAQEVDMNPVGGDYNYFDIQMIERLKKECVRPPYRVGNFILDASGNIERFDDDEKGMVKLWCVIEEETQRPTKRDYYVGCDIAVGTGATPSTMTVADGVSHEKVCEIADSKHLPYRWAELANAVGKWFHQAKLCWERNGPGREFGIRIKELDYPNVYQKTNFDTGVVSDIAGWQSGREEKRLLLSEYRQALFDGNFINRSRKALEECLDYMVGMDGTIEHSPSKHSQDPTGARENHGDRVIADAVCYLIMKTTTPYEGEIEEDVPENCIYQRAKDAMNGVEKNDWW